MIVYISLNSSESSYSFKCSSSSPSSQKHNVKTGPSFMHGVVGEYVCECVWCLQTNICKNRLHYEIYRMTTSFVAWIQLNNTQRDFCSDSVSDTLDLLLIDIIFHDNKNFITSTSISVSSSIIYKRTLQSLKCQICYIFSMHMRNILAMFVEY